MEEEEVEGGKGVGGDEFLEEMSSWRRRVVEEAVLSCWNVFLGRVRKWDMGLFKRSLQI